MLIRTFVYQIKNAYPNWMSFESFFKKITNINMALENIVTGNRVSLMESYYVSWEI